MIKSFLNLLDEPAKFAFKLLNWKDWRPELSEQPPLEELLKSLPDKIIKHYTIADTIIYRGMVIQDDKVYESTICSWTTDLNKAKEFANNEDYYDLVSSNLVGKVDQENRVNKVVYVKKGEGLDLDKLMKDTAHWLRNNREKTIFKNGLHEVVYWQTIKSLETSEGEVISDFIPSETFIDPKENRKHNEIHLTDPY